MEEEEYQLAKFDFSLTAVAVIIYRSKVFQSLIIIIIDLSYYG